jgi:hypothetical protein
MSHYAEFVIHGNAREIVAYLKGFAAGSGLERAFVFAAEAGFHIGALRERIKHHGDVTHVICDAPHRDRLRAAIKQAPPPFEFDIKEERKIERAYFPFSFETPNRKTAEMIKAVLGSLPKGVKAADYSPHEVTDPSARGPEVYSPAHEYTFSGRGVIEGDVLGVVETRHALMDIEFTKCDEISVHHAA